jgi:prevent-host-death family protein
MAGAIRVDLGRVDIVSMRELTLNTAHVIERLRSDGLPRVIVKHGRFQAALIPLRAGIEGELVSSAIDVNGLIRRGSTEAVPVEDLIRDTTISSPEVGATETRQPDPQQRYGVVGMSELSQRPSAVVSRVRDGEHLVITRHGRWVAILMPLPTNFESSLVSKLPDFMATLDDGTREFSSSMTIDQAEAWYSSD